MYSILMFALQAGVAIASLFSKKVKLMWQGECRAVATLRQQIDPQARYIWFHAASLGEFEQGRPIIEQLRRQYPTFKILLTFFSPSGYEVRKNYQGADIVCYLPIDTPVNARRFLDAAHPCMAFFIKYEFWYNYLHILSRRGVPTYSVSSIFRKGQIFFRWYGRYYAQVLKCFTYFFVQNKESVQLLASLGITNVAVTGDTRFDRVLQIKADARELPIVQAFVSSVPPTADPVVLVAGSSWPPDEEMFIRYFKAGHLWKLIIAPHVVSEAHLSQILAQLNGKNVVRYTQTTPEQAAEADCLIIDCYGLLSSIYRYGQIAYVGGGFGVGIHNVLEAAVWGIPVVFGPNNQRFREAQNLKKAGGGFDFSTYEAFEERMYEMLSNANYRQDCGNKAAAYVQEQSGATQRIMRGVNSSSTLFAEEK